MTKKRHSSLLVLFIVALALFLRCFTAFSQSLVKSEVRIDKAWLLGKINYETDPRFVLLKKPYTKRSGIYLHRQAYRAFINMYKAARKENVILEVLSGARSFDRQKRIWQAKWEGKTGTKNFRVLFPKPLQRAKQILQYSSMPATSRHHWGTDIDINSLNNAYFQRRVGKRVYLWLQKNGQRFGFCQVYTKKEKSNRSGYEEESWHWSYLPLSRKLLRAYNKQISYKDIQGFPAANIAPSLAIIKNYVNGIDTKCR